MDWMTLLGGAMGKMFGGAGGGGGSSGGGGGMNQSQTQTAVQTSTNTNVVNVGSPGAGIGMPQDSVDKILGGLGLGSSATISTGTNWTPWLIGGGVIVAAWYFLKD